MLIADDMALGESANNSFGAFDATVGRSFVSRRFSLCAQMCAAAECDPVLSG